MCSLLGECVISLIPVVTALLPRCGGRDLDGDTLPPREAIFELFSPSFCPPPTLTRHRQLQQGSYSKEIQMNSEGEKVAVIHQSTPKRGCDWNLKKWHIWKCHPVICVIKNNQHSKKVHLTGLQNQSWLLVFFCEQICKSSFSWWVAGLSVAPLHTKQTSFPFLPL